MGGGQGATALTGGSVDSGHPLEPPLIVHVVFGDCLTHAIVSVSYPIPQLKRYCQVAEYIVILRDDCCFTSFPSEIDNSQNCRDDDDENHNSKNDTNDHSNT